MKVAKQIGVSEDCITLWENGRSQPQIKYYPKIIQFLGYNPFAFDDSSLGGKIKKYRADNGITQEEFARLIGVDETTLRSWELNKRKPNIIALKKLEEISILEPI